MYALFSLRELVEKLQARGTAVFLVSGGMLEIIEPAARLLGISNENIFANRLKYYFDGMSSFIIFVK